MIEGRLVRTSRGGYQVFIDGEILDPEIGLRYINHSPDGFAWGYPGSGPSQLAFSILLKLAGRRFAFEHYADFKREVIALLNADKPFQLSTEEVQEWVKSRELVANV